MALMKQAAAARKALAAATMCASPVNRPKERQRECPGDPARSAETPLARRMHPRPEGADYQQARHGTRQRGLQRAGESDDTDAQSALQNRGVWRLR